MTDAISHTVKPIAAGTQTHIVYTNLYMNNPYFSLYSNTVILFTVS